MRAVLRPYEVMVILVPDLAEEAIRSVIDRATDVVRQGGGAVGRVDRWGKRRLVYEVAHRQEGYFVLIEASGEPAVVAELDRTLSLSDEVVRHKIVRRPARRAARVPRSPAAAVDRKAG
ncbi:MAG: 30S ribosomal protein S6 [Acidimicrobiales bacterium]